MKQGFETPAEAATIKAADARVKAWCERNNVELPYMDAPIPCDSVGGFNVVLVIDKIIERMSEA